MKTWIRKSLMVMVSILTFGLITPAQMNFLDQVNADTKSPGRGSAEFGPSIPTQFQQTPSITRDQFIEDMVKLAETRSYEKFGTRIKPVIENEFKEIILPNIEQAISKTAAQFPEEDLTGLAISEQPGAGLSEKIFHIKDVRTGKDVIRFHVRRDNPPQAGYWFNFHYHTAHDSFQEHHELGSIYWDKNTPPKWMA
ncbi:YpjP family protein [Bacillus sp. EB01]|uniref:YpjP family protein n=1 Tax=Bacillus sp. EB01 TaxID=1347086 RepID=UPI000B32DAB4|nr:YpjP family protein [Bacillus sp. EB01]